ncbi:hypothetical protein LJC63_08865 [Ruminococcaceae bacterium OttesenSCG-928-L11]|nr:hypothetical protein [Ruminococcaceae bacterium OttesenSCG-928-L11]
MKSTKYFHVLKHTVYGLLFLIFYILQSVPGFLTVMGVKPVWVLPAAIILAMFEGEFLGGIYGALAGLLCDIGGFLLFGFNGFLTCLYCVGVGLVIIYLLRCNLLGGILLTLIFMVLRGSLEFLFEFGMWGYDGVWKIYLAHTLPTALYSTVLAIPLFYLFRGLSRKFNLLLQNS